LETEGKPIVPTATYSIQIGAYSKLDNAIRCKEAVSLILAQGSVEIEPAGAIYRVKVTKVKGIDLEKTKVTLTSGGYSNFVVKEELK
jgi:hemin uptake protein HemP